MPPTPLPTPGPVTRLVRIVQPADANSQGSLFGGEAMRFMDEAGAVAAIRYTHGSVVTAHVDAVDFRSPVPIGAILEASSQVTAVGRTSLVVEVVLECEDRGTAARTVTTTGRFVFVAIDDEGLPREIA
jgi:acyl-CoA thioesterase YciA